MAGNLKVDRDNLSGGELVTVENSRLGLTVILVAEGMFFAGFFAALLVLQAKQGVRGSVELNWIPTAILALAFAMTTIARRGCRDGVSLASHWAANLGIVAVVGWGFGNSGFLEAANAMLDLATLAPAAACAAVVLSLLGIHLIAALVPLITGVFAMVQGHAERASEKLKMAENLLLFALVVQAVLSLLSFL